MFKINIWLARITIMHLKIIKEITYEIQIQ